MEQLVNFLFGVRGDVFKLLPMKESAMDGEENHILEYIESLLINLKGAMSVYPVLNGQKQYLYVVNNLEFLSEHVDNIEFNLWRRIILNSTSNINLLFLQYKKKKNAKR